jgi:NTE family protein
MKIGLVLAGGGARGGYQIGAIKALEELGFKYEVITGTSIGALNALMLLSDRKDILYKMWEELDFSSIMEHDFKWKNKSLEIMIKAPLQNGFKLTPAEKLIEEYLDEDKVRSSNVKCGIVHTQRLFKYNGCKIEDIPYGELKTYLLASCSAHPFLKLTTINGKKVRDGWYSDNVPINLALELGAQRILAIDIMWGINKKVDKNVDVYYLRPSKKLKFFLNFSNDVIRDSIKLGYEDVMNKKEEILAFLNK